MSLSLTIPSRPAILAAAVAFLIYTSAWAADNRRNSDIPDFQKSAESKNSGLCLTGLCPKGVLALCEYNGDLYAEGFFASAGCKPIGRLARWDCGKWHNVGGGKKHYVYVMVVYDGELIAGGVFDTVGGVSMDHIAAWDGVSWAPLGDGVNRKPGVTDLCVYDGNLIVSGTIDSAAFVSLPNITKGSGILINHLYREGQAPSSPEVADLNNDGAPDVGNAIMVIGFIYREGAPLDCVIG